MLVFIIVSIVIITLFGFVGFRMVNQTSKVMDALSNRLGIGSQVAKIGGSDSKYLGGHPFHANTGIVLFSLRERGFVMSTGGKASASYYSDVKDIRVMSQDQIHKDVTLTRLLALGVFALAAKKTTVTHQQFLRIVLNVKGIDNSILIQSPHAGRIASIMNNGRILVHAQ